MHRRAALVLAAVLALGVTACDAEESPRPAPTGTTSSTPDGTQPHSEAVRADVAALYTGNAPSPEEATESECFAEAFLDRVDPAALEQAGIVQDGAAVAALPRLDAATAEAWVGAQEDCTDFVEASTRAVGAQSKGKVDAEAYAACLRDAIAPDQVHAALVNTLSGAFESPEVTALGEAQAGCVRSASPSD